MKKISLLTIMSFMLLSGCATSGFHKIEFDEAIEIIAEMAEIENETESLVANDKFEGIDQTTEREVKLNLEDDIAYYKDNEIELYTTRELVEEVDGHELYEYTTYDVNEKKYIKIIFITRLTIHYHFWIIVK